MQLKWAGNENPPSKIRQETTAAAAVPELPQDPLLVKHAAMLVL
jgi:hypothetical protein